MQSFPPPSLSRIHTCTVQPFLGLERIMGIHNSLALSLSLSWLNLESKPCHARFILLHERPTFSWCRFVWFRKEHAIVARLFFRFADAAWLIVLLLLYIRQCLLGSHEWLPLKMEDEKVNKINITLGFEQLSDLTAVVWLLLIAGAPGSWRSS